MKEILKFVEARLVALTGLVFIAFGLVLMKKLDTQPITLDVGKILFGLGVIQVWYDFFFGKIQAGRLKLELEDAVRRGSIHPSAPGGLGVIGGYEVLEDNELRNILGRARSIRILKTWFPETPTLLNALDKCLGKPSVKVELFLCEPDSPILESRCKGALTQLSDESSRIIKAVQSVYKHRFASNPPLGNASVTIYKGWPSVPLIECDQDLFVGFYLRGNPSPQWPWLLVDRHLPLGSALVDQFKKFPVDHDPKYGTQVLSTKAEFEKWLKSHP
jgi:hypothetical protein